MEVQTSFPEHSVDFLPKLGELPVEIGGTSSGSSKNYPVILEHLLSDFFGRTCKFYRNFDGIPVSSVKFLSRAQEVHLDVQGTVLEIRGAVGLGNFLRKSPWNLPAYLRIFARSLENVPRNFEDLPLNIGELALEVLGT